MGFIEAQQELTILTIIIPILYVALYTAVNAALQLSVGLVVFGGETQVCIVVGGMLCPDSLALGLRPTARRILLQIVLFDT